LPRGGDAERLAALVQTAIGADAFWRKIDVFRAQRADRLKLVFRQGTGLGLFAEMPESGVFRWPRVQGGAMHLSAAQLAPRIDRRPNCPGRRLLVPPGSDRCWCRVRNRLSTWGINA